MIKLFLFASIFSISLAYHKLETKSLNICFHDDMDVRDLDKDKLDEIHLKISKLLDVKLKEIKKSDDKLYIFISPYDISKGQFPSVYNNRKEDIAILLTSGAIYSSNIFNEDEFLFLFAYSLARVLIKQKIQDSMPTSLGYIDYIFSVRKYLTKLLVQNWLIDGSALKIARDTLKKEKKSDETLLIDKYAANALAAIKYSYIEGNDVRYPIEPHSIFTYLNKSDFYIKYIFSDFLEFYSNRYGEDKCYSNLKQIFSLVKAKNMWEELPIESFINENPNIFKEWMDGIKSKKESYSSIFDLSRKSHLQFRNDNRYYLETTSSGSNLLEESNIKKSEEGKKEDGKEVVKGFLKAEIKENEKEIKEPVELESGSVKLYASNVEHFCIYENEIYYTRKDLDVENDRYVYSLFKEGKLIKKNVSAKFFVTKKGIYWIHNHGLRDSIFLDEKEVLSRDYGIKVDRLVLFKDHIYLSGRKDGEKIFRLNEDGVEVLDDGSFIFVSESNIFYSKRDGLYKGDDRGSSLISSESGEGAFNKGIYLLQLDLKHYCIKKIEEKESHSKGYTLALIKRDSIIQSFDFEIKDSTGINIYPDISIFDLSIGLAFELEKGELAHQSFIHASASLPIWDAISKKRFNLQFSGIAETPIHISRLNRYFIPQIGFEGSICDGSYVKVGFRLVGWTEVYMYQKMGAFGSESGKSEFNLILSNPYTYFHYAYGNLNKCVGLNEIQVILMKCKKEKQLIVFGNKYDYVYPVNFTIEDYRLKIENIGLGIYTYVILGEMVNYNFPDMKFVIGPKFMVDMQIYGYTSQLEFCYSVLAKNIKESHFKFNWSFR